MAPPAGPPGGRAAPPWALLILGPWREHPGQPLLAVLALAVGVALAWAVHLVNHSALAEFDRAVQSVQGRPDLEVRARSADSADFDEAALDLLASQPGITLAAPVIEGPVWVQPAPAAAPHSDATPAAPQLLRLQGIDALRQARLTPDLLPQPAAGQDRLAGLDPQRVFLNAAARRVLGDPPVDSTLRLRPVGDVGDRATAPAVDRRTGPPTSENYFVAGTVAASGGPLMVMDVAGAQVALQRGGRLSRIGLRLAEGVSPEATAQALAAAPGWPAGLRLARPEEAGQRLDKLSRAYRVNLSVLALVALFTGAFLVYAVQALAVARRVPQLALLGVLGLGAAARRRLVLSEALLLGGAGSALGLALGTALAREALARLGGDLGSAGMLGGLFGGEAGRPALQVGALPLALHAGLGLAAALVGSWYPARAAQALAPAQALKGAGTAAAPEGPGWLGPALLLAGVLVALVPPLPDGSVAAWSTSAQTTSQAAPRSAPQSAPQSAGHAAGPAGDSASPAPSGTWPRSIVALLQGLEGLPLPAYVGIALVLVGGVAAVPGLVGLVLRRLRPPQQVLALLVVERARDQRATATATVAGVVASLALCVALTVMVASFRASVTSWLDQVLPADLYVRVAGERAAGLVPPLPAALVDAAARWPEVAELRPQRVQPLLLDPRQAAVALLSRPIDLKADAASLRRELPLVGEPVPPRAGCTEVAVSEALQALHGASPGSILWLPLGKYVPEVGAASAADDGVARTPAPADAAGVADAGRARLATAGMALQADTRAPGGAATGRPEAAVDGAPGTVTVASTTRVPAAAEQGCPAPQGAGVAVHVRAVWRDYARQQGALVIDRTALARLTGADPARAPANDVAIWLRPGADAASVQARLQATLAALVARGAAEPGATLQFATPGEIRAISLAVFDRSFVVTRWLQGVAITLGLVGVAASFSAQVLARRKEFGALQHLGFTRRQLVTLVAGEGALWCGLGALLGLALGLVISVILVDLVNPQSFHWTMDLSLPLGRLASLAAAVVLAGAGAAAWAGRSAASAQMAQAVKEDW